MRTYSELLTLKTFEERFEYLKLGCGVGDETFGYDRYLNQTLYNSYEWRQIRKEVILRDQGCDLGIFDREIPGKILIHHMNPITVEDILERRPVVFNPEYLITVSNNTHQAIHYGDEKLITPTVLVERSEGDTCPWK